MISISKAEQEESTANLSMMFISKSELKESTASLRKLLQLNKRGDEVSGAGALLRALLAIVILVLLVWGFYGAMTGHWIPNFIPSFNQTSETKSELALVRYVISEDRVDYYDGATWREFGEAERELQGKTYNGAVLRRDLREHYFDSQEKIRKAENVEFYNIFDGHYIMMSGVISRSYEDPRELWEARWTQEVYSHLMGSEKPMKKGDVILELWKREGKTDVGKLQALYVLRGVSGEIVRISRRGQDFFDGNPTVQGLVRQKALAWRESVLQRAARVMVQEGEAVYVCLKRTTGSEDLVADLSKDVGESATCGERT